jgi:hypothetical protein
MVSLKTDVRPRENRGPRSCWREAGPSAARSSPPTFQFTGSTRTCLHSHTFTHMHRLTRAQTYIHTHAHTYTSHTFTRHTRTHTCARMHTHSLAHTYTRAYAHRHREAFTVSHSRTLIHRWCLNQRSPGIFSLLPDQQSTLVLNNSTSPK